MSRAAFQHCLLLTLALTASLASPPVRADFLDWWFTPDQQGQRLLERGEPEAAAEHFTTPERIGAALFDAGRFEDAAAVFGRVRGPQGAYNRGNALIMLGQYENAIASFDSALAEQPDWREAQENRAIAVARLANLTPPEDDAGGTGGMLGADEVVMDDTGRVADGGQEVVMDAGEQATDEDAMRALWLRRVDTDPSRFLSAKFAAQLAEESAGPEGSGDAPDPNESEAP